MLKIRQAPVNWRLGVKEMIETKEMLDAILHTIDEGIHVVNQKGYTIFYNRIAAIHDGMKQQEVIGKHILEVFPSLNHDTSTILQVLATKKPIINRYQQYTNKKGELVVTVNTTLPILQEGNLIGAVEIAKDIKRIKELSEKVHELQEKVYYQQVPPNKQKNQAYKFSDIITQNRKMFEIIDLAKKIADSPSPVLIQGETGTGKELIVQALHYESRRRHKPFIAQNCAAMPASLLESILFGTVKGSFTGAENRAGLFELAHQGTIFLDEIHAMPTELQTKLLRVLQEKLVRRVGDNVNRAVDVRIITATNVPAEIAVEKGLIRPDLYYRISVIPIILPPLRERKDDIPLLTKHFISKFNQQFEKSVVRISNQVMKAFLAYNWPGNIRELEHIIEYAMNIVDGREIDLEHLPAYFSDEMGKFSFFPQVINKERFKVDNNWEIDSLPVEEGLIQDRDFSLKEYLAQLEKRIILTMLEKEKYNIQKTASRLSIPRQTLQYKISKYFR